jgi:hypothetical protein
MITEDHGSFRKTYLFSRNLRCRMGEITIWFDVVAVGATMRYDWGPRSLSSFWHYFGGLNHSKPIPRRLWIWSWNKCCSWELSPRHNCQWLLAWKPTAIGFPKHSLCPRVTGKKKLPVACPSPLAKTLPRHVCLAVACTRCNLGRPPRQVHHVHPTRTSTVRNLHSQTTNQDIPRLGALRLFLIAIQNDPSIDDLLWFTYYK